jgi:hypothetical protein
MPFNSSRQFLAVRAREKKKKTELLLSHMFQKIQAFPHAFPQLLPPATTLLTEHLGKERVNMMQRLDATHRFLAKTFR